VRFLLIAQTIAICIIAAGRCLARRTRYTFILVMAAVECMIVPFGTVLGVLTIIVLSRDKVKRLFDVPPTGGGTGRAVAPV
jgi:hypothetical protein